MTNRETLHAIRDKAIISDQQAEAIDHFEAAQDFSVYRELRTILYIGILLFSSGIGILIYENIDTIGHQVIIALIALLTAACFGYVFKNRIPYSHDHVKNPVRSVRYVLLIGCTTFLALEGYLQYQYGVFGTKYGLAVLVPTILFFWCAYYFDHVGVLSMAITGLASWLGLTIAPLSIISKNDFTDENLLWSAIILGIFLVIIGWLSTEKDIKKHFTYTYYLLGGILASIACLTGLFNHKPYWAFFVPGLCLSIFFVFTAKRAQSLVFLLMGVSFGYVHITYMLGQLLGDAMFLAFGTFYFTFSCLGVVYFFLSYKKFLGIKKP